MFTKLKGTRSGQRSALTKLLRRFEYVKSNEEFDRNELSTIFDLIIDKQRFLLDLNTQIISELSEEELDAEILIQMNKAFFNDISILEAGQRVNLESDETLHSTVYLAKTNTQNDNNNNKRKPQRREVSVHTRKPCIYYGESHSSNTCMTIVDQKVRLEILKLKKACLIVLATIELQIVLLKTVIATVHSNSEVSMDANILFNEGAQCSFITEGLAEQLELKQKGAEVISISGFGGGNESVRHLKTADIFVRTAD
ncbi:unnamed protein product [Mytilus coruscus]|uniref:Peptidase aspartic putative domain-containing protein n=1 Tax=Mytilus coruscus TaxID=42192 RepID=A0A6J8BX14_MYTCO|nr:unnamed protein product [Mytilus coruscus]